MQRSRTVRGAALGLLIFSAAPASAAPAAAAPAATEYVSAARPNGVVGGASADALAKAVVEALRARHDVAEPDGALAAAAAWFVAADGDSRKRGAATQARRSGFVGAVLTAAAFPVGESDTWRSALAALPRNFPVTRYGVHVSADGGQAGVVFGDVGLVLQPFPRQLRPGQTLRLRGEVSRRFERASVHVTGVDGRVSKTPFAGRRFEVDLPLATAGIYRVEVMGDGATGPVVVANVPVYVGVGDAHADADADGAERRAQVGARLVPTPSRAPARTAEEAQARLLGLLNDSRRAAGLGPLIADAELGAVALAHTREMVAAHFFGHVSPTTGHAEDRVRSAGIPVTKLGENIVQGDSADAAHRRLMDSPSHRANMLEPVFTHVGIAVVVVPSDSPLLLATLVFARRPRALIAPVTSAVVSDFVSARRRARGVPPLAFDPLLQRAAEAGIEMVRRGDQPGATAAAALDAAQAALTREAKRLRLPRPAVCAQLVQVLELEQLEGELVIARPQLGRLGLAATAQKIGKAETIFVLTLVASATCK